MKKIFTLLLCIWATHWGFSQALPNRYKTEVFTAPQIVTTKNVVFSTNIPHVTTTNLFGNQIANEERYGNVTSPAGQIVTLRMNIYQPNQSIDTLTKRPVIIFCFGGGFVTGSRTETSMIQLCQSFARRGFVTATIDYRLGMNISNQELSKRAVYRGVQDGRSAVRFFRNNANTYKIDPNQIFIAGHSAGAFIALHNIYMDKDAERPASTRLYMTTRPDLSGLDDIGDNKIDANGNPVSGKANAAMGFAGALGKQDPPFSQTVPGFMEGANDAPGIYFHSSDDDVIPYNNGEPFSNLNWLPGFNLPIVHGSNDLRARAIALNAPYRFWGYTNRGHGVHFDGSNLYTDIAPRGSDFFYDFRLKPSDVTLSGSSVVCSNELTQTYSLNLNTNFYYDWQVVGGTINTTDFQYKNSISITWNPAAPTRSVTCTPYSRWLARALAPVSQTITINQIPNIGTPIGNRLYQISDVNPTINLTGAFTDPENSTMTYTATASPTGIINPSVSGNTLTIGILSHGVATVTVEATDAAGCKRSQSFTVTINRPPTVVNPVSNQTIRYADAPFVINDLSTIFSDPDGDALTYTIADAPTGVVTINRSGNQVTFTAQDINTTTITITANDGRGGSVSNVFSITVNRGTQIITFSPISTKFVDESPVTLDAVSDRGLPITFVLVSGNAAISGNTISFNQAGTIVVKATQPGNYFFEPAPDVERTFQVIRRSQIINFQAITTKFVDESPVNLVATASSGLPVNFVIVSGNGTISGNTLNFSTAGTIVVRALQSGNNVFEPAPDVEQSVQVVKRNQVINFEPIADKILTESGFNLNVSASSNLPVSLEIISGNATLNGKQVNLGGLGFVTIRASQSGNNTFEPAASVERTFYVAPEALMLTLSPNPFRDRVQMTLQGKYTGEVKVLVYDNLGRMFVNKQFSKESLLYQENIILETLPQGIYYFKIVTNEKTFVERMVKQ
jgi:acetyl esterase/lipase